ncbi:MAG: FMN-binding protein [candidate division WOR-3 bacterium]
MRKPLRTVLIVVAVLVVVGLGVSGCFIGRFQKMRKTMLEAPIADVDLSRLEDGVYTGSFGEFLVSVTARVKVEAHRIVSIELVDQRSGPGYEAKETVDRIIAAQSPKVDAVTGATGSSRCIMAAVYQALTAGR